MAFSREFLPEILVEIMSHLSTPDLKNCAIAKRSWSQEATRLLWHSITLEIEIYGAGRVNEASVIFAKSVDALTRQVQRAPYVRRLAIKMRGLIPDEVFFSIVETAQTFLSVPWESIAHALNPMHRLQYLELEGVFHLSRHFVPAVCHALSGAPIRTICSCLSIRGALREYAAWAFSITNLVIVGTVDYRYLPDFPHLRFLASNNIHMVSKFIISSPLDSLCFFGGSGTESELDTLANAIRAQASAGKSTLRSIHGTQFRSEKIFLRHFVGSLQCPTLEHIHLVHGGLGWSEPFNIADYAIACLEANSSSISQSLPALRSLRFDLFNHSRHIVPSERVQPEHASSHLVTGAGFRLSTWLRQKNHPPLLQHIQIYSMGAITKEPQAGCRTVTVEATRSLPLSGDIIDDSDSWEVTDAMEDVVLPELWSVIIQGLPDPLVISDRRTLPVVPGLDGVIRWSNPPVYRVVGLNGEQCPLTKEAMQRYLPDSRRDCCTLSNDSNLEKLHKIGVASEAVQLQASRWNPGPL
ncbi:hypothetical protein DL93DRAFT_2102426 [Clavulina sp. PMI_390]|nr:hypothetical protein DL93DRAFT_2102426 [Clavulina sp. PMI_390]